ncbi:ATP-dependent Clp protease proteolytic subunit [Candidatus Parabeggiatoa sp. HSG14]|uniref:ATP-dependent Clp protease proteolytic subunit n=1 Tax=Candidatus Parabeggiatoa sp. HSG14 TaxID=3055593 RepID=UPI0025A7F33C|nr:ATP-dependent Clp protease proteolytic subunit [Thiotrichales bacterium HSG14]
MYLRIVPHVYVLAIFLSNITLQAQEPENVTTFVPVIGEASQKHQQELRQLKQENELQLEKINHEIAKLTGERKRLELKNAIYEQTQQQILAALEAEKRKLALENELQEERLRSDELKKSLQKVEKAAYLAEPLVDGQLIISDRRIVLDGIIMTQTADFITKSIHFYNNEDPNYPIFLVIEKCPGGSIIEGARILQIMQNSQAPVYVVVKSLAASMGAIIATLGNRSFAYPNALIIYHEVSQEFYGSMNTTEMKGISRITKEWSKRVLEPVAKKMGITLAQFIQKMYEHNPQGDWIEFATEAQKLGWVDVVILGIHEASFLTNPSEEELDELEENDEIGALLKKEDVYSSTAKLPRLRYGDFYYLYNSENHSNSQ